MRQLGEAPFSFDFLVALAWIGLFLIIGILIRNVIPFLRKYLVPSCMLGGLAGVIILTIIQAYYPQGGTLLPSNGILQSIAWHMYCMLYFCIAFIAVFPKEKSDQVQEISNSKGSFWISFTYNGVTYLQTLVGMLAFATIVAISGKPMLVSQGALLGAAFAGGPGPAMGMAAVWEQAGHVDMVSIALGYAGIGFILSLVVGVVVINYLKKKSCDAGNECFSEDEMNGLYPEGKGEEAGKLTFMSSNVDSFAFIIAMILVVYLAVYAVVVGIKMLMPAQIMGMLWAMYPVFCLVIAFPIAIAFKKLGFYRYLDRGLLTRLQGFLVDFMAVAALMGINVVALKSHWASMITVSLLVISVTMIYLWWQTRKLKAYSAEYLSALTGWSTGTVTSGFVLLRMLDPEFKSPVPVHIGFSQLIISCFGLGLSPFLLRFQHGEALYNDTYIGLLLVTLVLFIIMTVCSRLPFLKMYGKEAKF